MTQRVVERFEVVGPEDGPYGVAVGADGAGYAALERGGLVRSAG